MDIQNHFYGHTAVLAHAAGQPRVRHLAGLVQHGWVVTSPLVSNMGQFPSVGLPGDRRRVLVWSHEARSWDPADEVRPTTAIGAPWLYLVRLMRDAGVEADPVVEPRPLIMPMHGTHVHRVESDARALADYYLQTEGPSTICLHVEDLKDPEMVAAWSVGGNQVVSAGGRFDTHFMTRLYLGMQRASRVVSNRAGTSTWYAASLGLPSCVHGPEPRLVGQGSDVGARMRELWPEVCTQSPDVDAVRAVSDLELGAGHLRDPEELRVLAGWQHPLSLRPAFDYWAGMPLEKAAAVVRGHLGRSRVADDATPGEGVPVAPAAAPPHATPHPLSFLRHPMSHLPRRLPESWTPTTAGWLRPGQVG